MTLNKPPSKKLIDCILQAKGYITLAQAAIFSNDRDTLWHHSQHAAACLLELSKIYTREACDVYVAFGKVTYSNPRINLECRLAK